MYPWPMKSKKVEETFSCLLPCMAMEDGYDEWDVTSSFDEQSASWVSGMYSLSTKASCEASALSLPLQHSRTNSVCGVYFPRKGRSAKVRFILPIESYLSGDYDLLPPTEEKAPKWQYVSSIWTKNPPLTPMSILKMAKESQREPQETCSNINQERQEQCQEYKGTVLVVAPGVVELQDAPTTSTECCEEEDSCEYEDAEILESREVPKDSEVHPIKSNVDVSQIYDEEKRKETRVDDECDSSMKANSRVSILKRFRSLRREASRGASVYNVFARRGRMCEA